MSEQLSYVGSPKRRKKKAMYIRTEEGDGALTNSGTISRREALKLLGGASLGLLALPVFSSIASAAGKLQQRSETLLGTFRGVKYVQYDGLFVGETSTGTY